MLNQTPQNDFSTELEPSEYDKLEQRVEFFRKYNRGASIEALRGVLKNFELNRWAFSEQFIAGFGEDFDDYDVVKATLDVERATRSLAEVVNRRRA
jgi:hypothetical protein